MGRARLRLELVDGCHEDWSAMPAAPGAGRSCAKCARDVVDLEGVTARRAAALLAAEEAKRGSVCARFAVDAETGEVRFAPEAAPPGRTFLRGIALAATLAAGCESVAGAAEPAKPAALVTPLALAPVAPGAPSSAPAVPLPPPPPGPVHPVIAASPDAGTDAAAAPCHPTNGPTHVRMGRVAIHRN